MSNLKPMRMIAFITIGRPNEKLNVLFEQFNTYFMLMNVLIGAMEATPGFIKVVSSDILQTIPKRDVRYEMTDKACPCTFAAG
jgi:hypothetical protein